MSFSKATQPLFSVSLIIPAILLGVGIFFLCAKIGLNNTIPGLVIVHAVPALPLVALAVLSRFRAYDMNHQRVRRNLSANRLAALMQVTMPQIRFSVGSGALFAFISSFEAAVVSLIISCGETTTPTRHMQAGYVGLARQCQFFSDCHDLASAGIAPSQCGADH